jgi:Domain of unknown function (DUF4136)
MAKRFSQLCINCAALLLVGCDSRISVSTTYDYSVRFEKYQTFALDAAPAELGPLGKQTLEESLRLRLTARGLREVPANEASLQVVCGIETESKPIASSVASRAYLPPNFGRYSGTAGLVQALDSAEHIYGSLIIDLVDTSTRELVFRGVAKGG